MQLALMLIQVARALLKVKNENLEGKLKFILMSKHVKLKNWRSLAFSTSVKQDYSANVFLCLIKIASC